MQNIDANLSGNLSGIFGIITENSKLNIFSNQFNTSAASGVRFLKSDKNSKVVIPNISANFEETTTVITVRK